METAILVSDSCLACKRLLDVLEKKGTLSNYRVVDVHSSEGLELAKALGVTAIPECVVVKQEGSGQVARRCTDEETKAILSGEAVGESGT